MCALSLLASASSSVAVSAWAASAFFLAASSSPAGGAALGLTAGYRGLLQSRNEKQGLIDATGMSPAVVPCQGPTSCTFNEPWQQCQPPYSQ